MDNDVMVAQYQPKQKKKTVKQEGMAASFYETKGTKDAVSSKTHSKESEKQNVSVKEVSMLLDHFISVQRQYNSIITKQIQLMEEYRAVASRQSELIAEILSMFGGEKR